MTLVINDHRIASNFFFIYARFACFISDIYVQQK